jgi:hypothetical protein
MRRHRWNEISQKTCEMQATPSPAVTSFFSGSSGRAFAHDPDQNDGAVGTVSPLPHCKKQRNARFDRGVSRSNHRRLRCGLWNKTKIVGKNGAQLIKRQSFRTASTLRSRRTCSGCLSGCQRRLKHPGFGIACRHFRGFISLRWIRFFRLPAGRLVRCE